MGWNQRIRGALRRPALWRFCFAARKIGDVDRQGMVKGFSVNLTYAPAPRVWQSYDEGSSFFLELRGAM